MNLSNMQSFLYETLYYLIKFISIYQHEIIINSKLFACNSVPNNILLNNVKKERRRKNNGPINTTKVDSAPLVASVVLLM